MNRAVRDVMKHVVDADMLEVSVDFIYSTLRRRRVGKSVFLPAISCAIPNVLSFGRHKLRVGFQHVCCCRCGVAMRLSPGCLTLFR